MFSDGKHVAPGLRVLAANSRRCRSDQDKGSAERGHTGQEGATPGQEDQNGNGSGGAEGGAKPTEVVLPLGFAFSRSGCWNKLPLAG